MVVVFVVANFVYLFFYFLHLDPEILIRTSGEYRLSNFLLWQVTLNPFKFFKNNKNCVTLLAQRSTLWLRTECTTYSLIITYCFHFLTRRAADGVYGDVLRGQALAPADQGRLPADPAPIRGSALQALRGVINEGFSSRT